MKACEIIIYSNPDCEWAWLSWELISLITLTENMQNTISLKWKPTLLENLEQVFREQEKVDTYNPRTIRLYISQENIFVLDQDEYDSSGVLLTRYYKEYFASSLPSVRGTSRIKIINTISQNLLLAS